MHFNLLQVPTNIDPTIIDDINHFSYSQVIIFISKIIKFLSFHSVINRDGANLSTAKKKTIPRTTTTKRIQKFSNKSGQNVNPYKN